MLNSRQMKKIMLFLLTAGLLFSSCAKEDETSSPAQPVTVRFSVDPLSDPQVRSVASTAENALRRIAVIGVNADNEVEQVYPIIENPGESDVALTVSNRVTALYAIANPSEEMIGGLEEVVNPLDLVSDFGEMPQSPFLMGGNSPVTGQAVAIELFRAIAKIKVSGVNGFTVNSLTVLNTPDKGYVFGRQATTVPEGAAYVGYEELSGRTVYVAENTTVQPTRLLVKGTYKNEETAYTISLTDNGVPLGIKRNTCYEVTVNPVTESECEISVSIPEWEDVQADDNYIPDFGTYMAADFHQHTGFSDGSHPITFVLNQGLKYGLDVAVNSEHGGAFAGNASEGDQETGVPNWVSSGLQPEDFKGDATGSGDGRKMWRWQSIKEYSYPKILEFNNRNTGTLAIQGLEWNPPGHEHCSTGIITGQFGVTNPNADAMAQFEYMFDLNDKDKTGGVEFGWEKSTEEGHQKTMEAARWLQKNHRFSSWMVPAHPERRNAWHIADYRDLNDVAPDVFTAFESIPGHQASASRGGIGNNGSFKNSYTFGGVGIQAAQIGGLWDAMLSEGRNFWLVANSDYHAHVTKGSGDFYPGEYQKTYISMKDKTPQAFVDGLRGGNIYTVHGDLIDRLEFSVGTATMGQTHKAKGASVKVRILVRDPESNNNNTFTALTNPVLDHIDLIAGEMRAKVSKGDAEYTVDTYDQVEVIARFDANGGVTDGNGITSTPWIDLGNGLKLVEYTVALTTDTYFRLRGTNHGLNTAGTDENGNPLEDLPTANVQEGAKDAFEDLWFYSNPVFVRLP